MWFYLIKRLLLALLVVLGVLTLSFLCIYLAPGDPVAMYERPDIKTATVDNLRHQMGLDQSVYRQYLDWLKNLFRGNLGVSFMQHRPVLEILVEAIKNTVQLTVTVLLLQFPIGIAIGVLTAVRYKTFLSRTVHAFLLFCYSMPGFWLALMAVMLFSYQLGWLPAGQMRSFVTEPGFWPMAVDRLRHLILPVLVLALPMIAYTARFVRTAMIEILSRPYIINATALGLSRKTIIWKYALRNALLPLVTLLGIYIPFLLGGTVITEYIFAWPGMGRLTVQAIFSYDYPVIMATTMTAALAVVFGNLLADMLYAVVDPRVRRQF
jgi:peptide/nickel transport system permease protein